MAIYSIEYFNEGAKLQAVPWSGSLEQTLQVARDGLIRHGADFARIIDSDTGAEVDSVRRDAHTDERYEIKLLRRDSSGKLIELPDSSTVELLIFEAVERQAREELAAKNEADVVQIRDINGKVVKSIEKNRNT